MYGEQIHLNTSGGTLWIEDDGEVRIDAGQEEIFTLHNDTVGAGQVYMQYTLTNGGGTPVDLWETGVGSDQSFWIYSDIAGDNGLYIDNSLNVDFEGDVDIDGNSDQALTVNSTSSTAGAGNGDDVWIQLQTAGEDEWEIGASDDGTFWLYDERSGDTRFALSGSGANIEVDTGSDEALTIENGIGDQYIDLETNDYGAGEIVVTLELGEGAGGTFDASEMTFTNDGVAEWSLISNDALDLGADSFYVYDGSDTEFALGFDESSNATFYSADSSSAFRIWDQDQNTILNVDTTSDIVTTNGRLTVNEDDNNAFTVETTGGTDIFEVDTTGASATGVTIGEGTQIEKVLHFAVDFNPVAPGAPPSVICATGTVTGAATTDRIVANPDPSDLNNLHAWHGARVSALNTVEACFYQGAGTATDPGAAITVFGIIITP